MLREKGVADSIIIQVIQSQESRQKRQEEKAKGAKINYHRSSIIYFHFSAPSDTSSETREIQEVELFLLTYSYHDQLALVFFLLLPAYATTTEVKFVTRMATIADALFHIAKDLGSTESESWRFEYPPNQPHNIGSGGSCLLVDTVLRRIFGLDWPNPSGG